MDFVQGNKMFKTQHPQIVEFVTKYGMWVAYVLMGLVGKFGWDIITNRKLSFRYMLGSSLCGMFTGYLASVWCMEHSPTMGAYLVPVMTLLSRDVFLFLFSLNWKSLLTKMLESAPKK